MAIDLEIGEVVISKAGRDKGRHFFVVKKIDKDFVLISDGNLRKIEKPKKKNIKHLKPKGNVCNEVKTRVENGKSLKSREIRKLMSNYV